MKLEWIHAASDPIYGGLFVAASSSHNVHGERMVWRVIMPCRQAYVYKSDFYLLEPWCDEHSQLPLFWANDPVGHAKAWCQEQEDAVVRVNGPASAKLKWVESDEGPRTKAVGGRLRASRS